MRMIVWIVTKEEEKGDVCREESNKLSVGRWHSIAFAQHFCNYYQPAASSSSMRGCELFLNIRVGLSSLIYRFKTQFNASQPICPANMITISISRVLHTKEAYVITNACGTRARWAQSHEIGSAGS